MSCETAIRLWKGNLHILHRSDCDIIVILLRIIEKNWSSWVNFISKFSWTQHISRREESGKRQHISQSEESGKRPNSQQLHSTNCAQANIFGICRQPGINKYGPRKSFEVKQLGQWAKLLPGVSQPPTHKSVYIIGGRGRQRAFSFYEPSLEIWNSYNFIGIVKI